MTRRVRRFDEEAFSISAPEAVVKLTNETADKLNVSLNSYAIASHGLLYTLRRNGLTAQTRFMAAGVLHDFPDPADTMAQEDRQRIYIRLPINIAAEAKATAITRDEAVTDYIGKALAYMNYVVQAGVESPMTVVNRGHAFDIAIPLLETAGQLSEEPL